MIRPAAIVATSLLSVCCATKPAVQATQGPAPFYPRPVVDCSQWPSDAVPCGIVDQAEKRNVWIWSDSPGRDRRYCSGVIISTHHVLTAGHCLGSTMLVDNASATVLRQDPKHDLMLLNVKTADYEPLQINLSPVQSEPVYQAANHEPRMGIFRVGRVEWIDRDEVCVNTISAPGTSGSAIYDSKGRLVTIAQAAQAARFDPLTPVVMFTIGTHPKIIAEFLGVQ